VTHLRASLGLAAALGLAALAAAADPQPPKTVKELWAGFDPRKDALDVKLVREWESGGVCFRTVTFHVGTFKGKAARIAAFYAFPKGEKNLPALLHIHGGGQRAFLSEVEFYARRGYACLSVNWGGREMEEAQKGDPNTDWGAVDPTQNNVPGYFNLKPGEKYLDPEVSPRNNNWYLLTLGCRRGLTFLEQQPEVDAERLGVYGHSMGGNLTVYVAGADPRVKAASPSVGGAGFWTQPRAFLPEYKPQLPNADVKLFEATLGFESYAPGVSAPLLWLGATNDFHGVMDDTYRTGDLIPHEQVRYSFAPHLNHLFTPEVAVTRPLWFDQHLKAKFSFPATPKSELALAVADHVPELRVTPDRVKDVADVHLYYSVDPDPRARFWRSAYARRSGDTWTAALPLLDATKPLFAFANVSYKFSETASAPQGESTTRFALSTLLHTADPKDLKKAGVLATDKPDAIVDDGTHGWRDWYVLNGSNPHHWEFSTRKVNDPKWRGRAGQRLSLMVQADEPNDWVIVLTENYFRSYRGKQREYTAVVRLTGGEAVQAVALKPADFIAEDKKQLASWAEVDVLSLRAYYEKSGTLLGSKSWKGRQPVLHKLWWQGGE
jgi:dienelactone hydrolase